ncbi:uncharacterized protein SPPG_08900 [Spizellomyces punctatus DAOM BR117]|uniref:Uncharacterized protein n=1 Tax=Spizellomyces punctatus (strain DAOM BR117) TaxID=645134 RepID=A0A0L0HRP9_SPIPD|nr:hypothetical protein, variant [Spizellomyces punctatus DAOM BR117]XP_016611594.1 uncharacterized protein SPPG_08900 [Spizellomyces punctatus DAOM BR117]KND03554.1 hypothetical protein, variant [Spizellomyces punctatus DAOM BR117]KND03555.1 hypothetical protein SPPG_08900 [Spizellomyces punctatus DAOM BR117]|eukprot:XP_016611593.1 hypothetical protein, variant [Spizellomyces punctatus DAOM BR117]
MFTLPFSPVPDLCWSLCGLVIAQGGRLSLLLKSIILVEMNLTRGIPLETGKVEPSKQNSDSCKKKKSLFPNTIYVIYTQAQHTSKLIMVQKIKIKPFFHSYHN